MRPVNGQAWCPKNVCVLTENLLLVPLLPSSPLPSPTQPWPCLPLALAFVPHFAEYSAASSAGGGGSGGKKAGVGKQHNTLPFWGNETSMNLNPLILANIQSSSYFKGKRAQKEIKKLHNKKKETEKEKQKLPANFDACFLAVHLFKLKTYHEVVDEIYYQVKHMEPWERGSRKTSGQTGMCGGVSL